MSLEETSRERERELLVSHQSSIRIEEVDGKPVARFSVLPVMQGHTFAVELSDTSSDVVAFGPFRLEYALASEFLIYEDVIPSSGFEAGYSHLSLTPKMAGAALLLKYSDTNSPDIQRQATLTFSVPGTVLQRLIVETDEPELSRAIRHINHIVADLLDALSLKKGVPIAIRHIDVTAAGSKYHRRYVTLPYGQHALTEFDFSEAQNIPLRLRGAAGLFRGL